MVLKFNISVEEAIPHHAELLAMSRRVLLGGWLGVAISIAVGATLTASFDSLWIEFVGSVIFTLGALGGAGMVRCRECELTVKSKRVEVRCGPLKQTLPTGAVEAATRQPARGWHRAFAEETVVLELSVGDGRASVPSARADELIGALDRLR